MHSAIASGIVDTSGAGAVVRTATLDDRSTASTEDVLADTDVLTWWGHAAHAEVSDDVVQRVHRHVLSGWGSSCCTPGTGRRSSGR
jgi:trehalose utilization protein